MAKVITCHSHIVSRSCNFPIYTAVAHDFGPPVEILVNLSAYWLCPIRNRHHFRKSKFAQQQAGSSTAVSAPAALQNYCTQQSSRHHTPTHNFDGNYTYHQILLRVLLFNSSNSHSSSIWFPLLSILRAIPTGDGCFISYKKTDPICVLSPRAGCLTAKLSSQGHKTAEKLVVSV